MTCRSAFGGVASRGRGRVLAAALALTLAVGTIAGPARAQDEIPGRLILQLTENGARVLATGRLDVPVPPGGADLEPRIEPLFPRAPSPLDRFAVLTFRAARAADPRAQNAIWSQFAVQSRNVAAAEPDRVFSFSALPDDPYFAGEGGLPRQWHLSDSGLSLHADRAWPFVPAGSGVPVAVIDSGVDWDHPDLGGSAPPGGVIYTNPAELAGTDGVDDDGNGYVDDVMGWDFVETDGLGLTYSESPVPGEDGHVPDNDPSDVFGHGTYIAGIITAVDRNGIGIAAAAPGARILPVRVGWASNDGGGKVAPSFCAQGLYYAAERGVRVANCSWDSRDISGLGAALDVVIDTYDMVVVGSAGNASTNSSTNEYLAARSDCLGVAGIIRDGTKGRFSNYGPWVDVAGFYQGMVSTWVSGGAATYDTTNLRGTSWSAPNVSALAAMLRAVDPVADAATVRLSIVSTARDLSDLEPVYADGLGSGLVQYPDAVHSLGGGWEAAVPARGLARIGDGESGVVYLGTTALEQVGAGTGTAPAGWEGGEAYAGLPETFLPLATPWGSAPSLVVWGEAGTLHGIREPGTAEPGWPVALPAGAASPVAADVAGSDAIFVAHGSDVLTLFPSGGGGVDTASLGIAVGSLAVSGAAPDGTVLFAGDDGNGNLVVWMDGPSGRSPTQSVDLGRIDTPPVIAEFDGPGIPEAVVAGPDTLFPATHQFVYFVDGTGTATRSPHGLDAAPIRFLSLAGFADGMSERVAAVDSAGVLHLFEPAAGPFPGAPAVDLGGPATGEVLCADLDGDYQSDLIALRRDGTLLAFHADLFPLAGFPRHFPAGFDENPVIVDDGERRYVVAADTTGHLWSLPAGPAGMPAPWPAARGTPGRSGFLGHDRATPASPSVSALTWEWLEAEGRLCWSGVGLDAFSSLRVRSGNDVLWEGTSRDADCVRISPPPGRLDLEGLPRTGGWTFLAATAVGARAVMRVGLPFPNPFRTETRLVWTETAQAPLVQIFDVRGRLVLATRSPERSSFRWAGTDGAGRPVAPGLYFLRITHRGEVAVRRVFKMP